MEEKWLFGCNGLLIAEECDGALDQVDTQVVVLGMIRLDPVVVAGEFRKIVIGFAREKSIEAIKSALKRPLVVGASGRSLVHGCEVPFAHRGRIPSCGSEYFGERGCIGDQPTPRAGETEIPVREGSDPDAVMIAAGEQAGSGGGTQAGGVEARVAQSACGQSVEVWGRDF